MTKSKKTVVLKVYIHQFPLCILQSTSAGLRPQHRSLSRTRIRPTNVHLWQVSRTPTCLAWAPNWKSGLPLWVSVISIFIVFRVAEPLEKMIFRWAKPGMSQKSHNDWKLDALYRYWDSTLNWLYRTPAARTHREKLQCQHRNNSKTASEGHTLYDCGQNGRATEG